MIHFRSGALSNPAETGVGFVAKEGGQWEHCYSRQEDCFSNWGYGSDARWRGQQNLPTCFHVHERGSTCNMHLPPKKYMKWIVDRMAGPGGGASECWQTNDQRQWCCGSLVVLGRDHFCKGPSTEIYGLRQVLRSQERVETWQVLRVALYLGGRERTAK